MELVKNNMEKNEVVAKIKEEAISNHVPILQDKSLEFIRLILRLINPKEILEIGTAVGYSAINFVLELDKNVKVKTIEKNEKMYNKAIDNIVRVDLSDKIEVVLADATEYLPNLKEENKYDVVFIDAAKGQYLKFLENGIRLVKNGGVIIADNVLFKGRVLSNYNEHKHRTAVNRLRDYIKIITDDERLNSTVLDIGDGIAVSKVNKNLRK